MRNHEIGWVYFPHAGSSTWEAGISLCLTPSRAMRSIQRFFVCSAINGTWRRRAGFLPPIAMDRDKIGESHLTYAQGASAELVANNSGLQWAMVRNLAMAWVLTLPAAMFLSGSLYWLFAKLF